MLVEKTIAYLAFSYQYDIRIRLCSPKGGGSHGSYGSPLNTSLVVNVWNSLPLNSDDFSSLHCFRSSLNNIDLSRFLIIE